jgi:hypothetical protein
MTREVYPKKEFVEFSRKNIFMRVFADTDPEGARLQRKLGVEGFPTLVVLDPNGREVGRIMGERSVQDLIEELEAIFGGASKKGRIRL